jgi:farnesyl-diphosphate farnesyltransferase
MRVLEETSRTFYVPIAGLPYSLQEAVTSAYLCMRAIDEVEDHPNLDPSAKAQLLRGISSLLQSQHAVGSLDHAELAETLSSHRDQLPEVTLRIGEWACYAPESIAFRVWDSTAAMADRMAHWAARGWRIETEADLDCYTFGVAGAVGLLLSDLWAWHDGTRTNRSEAIGFGRGLQAVNILRNRPDDLARGRDFFPPPWRAAEMEAYARRNLRLADAYVAALSPGPVRDFCQLPLALAWRTLTALQDGQPKLSRTEVVQIMQGLGAT